MMGTLFSHSRLAYVLFFCQLLICFFLIQPSRWHFFAPPCQTLLHIFIVIWMRNGKREKTTSKLSSNRNRKRQRICDEFIQAAIHLARLKSRILWAATKLHSHMHAVTLQLDFIHDGVIITTRPSALKRQLSRLLSLAGFSLFRQAVYIRRGKYKSDQNEIITS